LPAPPAGKGFFMGEGSGAAFLGECIECVAFVMMEIHIP
jgi:hypothetical protein